MSDLSQVIKPKSDQLNADDLVSGDLTIRIREVRVNQGAKEQPVAIFFDGDNGKPWKPCKTMARALTQLWGTCDSQQFVGRSVVLYNDPSVTWAGVKVGGIRIRAVSHMAEPTEIAVSKSKGQRALMRVGTINAEVRQMAPAADEQDKFAAHTITTIGRAPDLEKFEAFVSGRQAKVDALAEPRPDLWQSVTDAIRARRIELTPGDADHIPDAFEPEGRADTDMGEGFTDAPEDF